MRIEPDDKGVGERECLGIIKPGPAMVSVDGERFSPESHERGIAQFAAQACEHRSVGLEFEVETIAERDRDPKQQDGLP